MEPCTYSQHGEELYLGYACHIIGANFLTVWRIIIVVFSSDSTVIVVVEGSSAGITAVSVQ